MTLCVNNDFGTPLAPLGSQRDPQRANGRAHIVKRTYLERPFGPSWARLVPLRLPTAPQAPSLSIFRRFRLDFCSRQGLQFKFFSQIPRYSNSQILRHGFFEGSAAEAVAFTLYKITPNIVQTKTPLEGPKSPEPPGLLLGAQAHPKSAHEHTRAPREPPKNVQELPKSAQGRPKTAQERPKSLIEPSRGQFWHMFLSGTQNPTLKRKQGRYRTKLMIRIGDGRKVNR